MIKPSARPALTPALVADLTLEITLRTTPQAVWQALTDDIGRWWPGVFFCGSGPGPRKFLLEAWPGGRMWEDHGAGNGLLWGTVVNLHREQLLEVAGTAWGPCTWLGRFQFTAEPSGTRLRFTESGLGRLDETTLAGKDKGWRFLFDGCLRAHLEGGTPPAWDETAG